MKERNQYFKEVMQTKRHDDWQEPFDVLKKRRSNKDKNVHDGSPTSSTLKPEEEDVGRKTDYEMYFEGAEDFMDEDDSESSDGGLESESEDSSTAAFKNPDDTPEQKAKAPFKSDVGPIPHSWSFQIELASLLSKHRTDLSLYNEIVDLTKKHTNGSKLKFSTDHLLKRKAIITKLEKTYESTDLKPKDVDVLLKNGQTATVSIFDTQAMILSLLCNEDLMKEENCTQLHRAPEIL